MDIMKGLLFVLWLGFPLITHAESAGAATSTPKLLMRMVNALENSKIERLRSCLSDQGNTSYHMTKIAYLGMVPRDGNTYPLAKATFLRSSPKGRDTPPARGHTFLILFGSDFSIASHAQTIDDDYHVEKNLLKVGQQVIADFNSRDPRIRYRGWLVGSGFLAYPFSDKISESEWNGQ